MEEVEAQQESLDQVGSLTFSPPPMRKSDTRDSISSVDSDVSLSFDRRGSKGEEGDLSDCASTDSEKHSARSTKKKSSDQDSGADSLEDTVSSEKEVREEPSSEKQGDKNEPDFQPPSEELADKICAQVEFYFSDENIVKDAFLLKHVRRNKEGYVSLKLIASFKRVKHLSRDWRVVGAALVRSKKLQVNSLGTKLRRVDPLPQFDQTTPSRTILAARLPVERLSVEAVAEIFRRCGEIALIRVLKPGHPAPAEVRQAIAKRPELASSEECAMVEFSDSASARTALQMSIAEAKIFALQQSDKKRKQQPTKKNALTKLAREDVYNSSSCASGSEPEDSRSRHKKAMHGYPVYHMYTGQTFQGPLSPDSRLSRRLSSCSISGSEGSYVQRRLSSCSGSGSDTGSFGRRYSACSSSSETGYCHTLYPAGYYPPQSTRRFSCCSNPGNECFNSCPCTGRRGSADCGTFFRRLSNCSRDSGFDAGVRRLSTCSSGSEQGNFCRPRSNSGVTLTHLPGNVTRMPSGPDGTRGFGRPPRMSFMSTPMEPTC